MKSIAIFIILYLPLLTFSQSKEELIERITANPKDVSSISLIQKVGGYDPDYKELTVLFKKLDKKVRKSTQGQIFDRYLKALENSSVGKKAPSITQFDLEGSPYALSDLQGQYVLVDFWASWCPPCRAENPKLVALYEEFKGKNFEILGISFDSEFENWAKAVKDDNLTWKHISDLQGWNNYASLIYGVKAIPQNILVDPQGIIIARNLHGDALRTKLMEVL
ncbi:MULTISPECIES: TlpA family protein disulfide reductase [Sphingobacterium]|uniref:TlpA family protein disulfide reductase n=1 Tax=Sphingobacterium populi TaxID=1812824 RepID=A0ABW5UAU5_9SPHI|nr:TlpA disulfide reductase family protein [Sphingobacterium sp. CFCC 11742]